MISGVKRLLKEAKELSEPNNLFHAQPLEVVLAHIYNQIYCL